METLTYKPNALAKPKPRPEIIYPELTPEQGKALREEQRSEHERQVEHAHESMADESRRVHFLEHGLCP